MHTGSRTYAELHLHLGGAVLPRILYSFMQKARQARTDAERTAHAVEILRKYPTYEKWERRLTRPSDSLTKYLEAHKLVEPLQGIDSIAYMVNRLLRGCYVFEHIDYLELRYNPFFRIPKKTHEADARQLMVEVVQTVAAAAAATHREYPIQFTQILCMDSRLPKSVNMNIVDLAAELKGEVAAIDLAGPDEAYFDNIEDLTACLKYAKETKGLRVTCHLFETAGAMFPDLLPYCDRIGHGLQIPLRMPKLLPQLARRKQCLELCPTTYFRTGTLKSYGELRTVFQQCFDVGVDIAICTDNSAFHGVRLPLEFERLLTHGVIDFKEMEICRQNAFKHAFRWPGTIERRTNLA
ncbi:MAG: adenosine deaminase [Chthonomonas sp.]|nr:adenosine deaminase [Chthonomonas sp.]